MKKVFHFFASILIIGAFGCNAINPAEKVPTYIQIDSVQVLNMVPAKHGSVSHKITDVWVYYNLQLLGAFELPAKVPVLAEGKGQLQVVAGIWDNGLSGTRAKYPFYNVDTFNFTASPTSTLSYTPKFIYRTTDTPLIKYYLEDFEQGNIFVSNFGDTTLIKTNESSEVLEGDWSGKITMTTDKPAGECITAQEYLLSPNKQCYMEFNYKSEAPFDVRMQVYHVGTTITSDVISFKSREEWTKVYVNLGGFASSFQYGKFKFIFKSYLPSDKTTAKLIVDNFKIIYFN
jgi:hypothetical protein